MKRVKTADTTLGVLLKILAIIGIFFSIFGFYVAVGVASATTQDVGTLITGPSDLFYFDVLGVSSIISIVAPHVPEALAAILKPQWPRLIAIAAVVFILLFARYTPTAKKWRGKMKEWATRHWQRSREHVLVRRAFPLLTSTTITPAFILAGGIVLLTTVSILVMSAMCGFVAGQAHVNKMVTPQISCGSLKENDSGNIHPVCARVSRRTSGVTVSDEGRVIVSGSSYVLLYDPCTGHSQRIGITGQTTIETIDSVCKPTEDAAKSPRRARVGWQAAKALKLYTAVKTSRKL